MGSLDARTQRGAKHVTRSITTVPCNTSAMYPFRKERKTSMPYQTINPFTEKLVKTFPEQTDEQLKTIIGQAHDTFSNDWSKRSLADRKKVLKNAVKLFRERREELAQYITLVFHQEFFAPVAMIFPVKNDDEAVKLANDSPYGLGGSIITNDVERGKRIARQIDTGMVFVNQACWTAPDLPFGGVKNSGYGRELSDLGIGEFVNKKLIRVV
jgi:acyl-CoA reductase-like NAD-dependent aldehyde dehydrogenase